MAFLNTEMHGSVLYRWLSAVQMAQKLLHHVMGEGCECVIHIASPKVGKCCSSSRIIGIQINLHLLSVALLSRLLMELHALLRD